jgi:hypothetical protein
MGAESLTELQNDIKATGEDIATDAERIRQIEQEKVTLTAGDPRLIELANESEALAAKLAVKAKVETALVEEAAERSAHPHSETFSAGPKTA